MGEVGEASCFIVSCENRRKNQPKKIKRNGYTFECFAVCPLIFFFFFSFLFLLCFCSFALVLLLLFPLCSSVSPPSSFRASQFLQNLFSSFFFSVLFPLQLMSIYRHSRKALELLRGRVEAIIFLHLLPLSVQQPSTTVQLLHVCRKRGRNLPCFIESGEFCSTFFLFCRKICVFLFIIFFPSLSTWVFQV